MMSETKLRSLQQQATLASTVLKRQGRIEFGDSRETKYVFMTEDHNNLGLLALEKMKELIQECFDKNENQEDVHEETQRQRDVLYGALLVFMDQKKIDKMLEQEYDRT